MKNILFAVVCLVAVVAAPVSSFAQTPGSLPMPTKAELESAIGGMGLSMGEKLSLRGILQGMQEKGAKVKDDSSLSDAQKTDKILKIRQDSLAQTQKVLTADQQAKLAALLLPKP